MTSPLAIIWAIMEAGKAVVRDRREKVMGDVHVLPVNEDRPPRERVGVKDPRVRQPADK